MGWDTPAILEQGINSDLPGEVKALVRSNVYDTATGKYLLIPLGSRLVGIYDSQVSALEKGLARAESDGYQILRFRLKHENEPRIRLDRHSQTK